MSFYFGENLNTKISHRIRMREIAKSATQWDHPIKCIFSCANAMGTKSNVLLLSKKMREGYALSIMTLALMADSNFDWWISIPENDPPDGFVGTFSQDEKGYTGLMREVEIVEHRGLSEDLYQTILKKMTDKSYSTNTVLTCLLLTSDAYDLKKLSSQLSVVNSKLDHIFVVFSGAYLDDFQDKKIESLTYTMTQLLPVYETLTFNLKPFMSDFIDRYNQGRESRLIEGDAIYYGTTNKNVVSFEQ
jgi:hypothetical protein